MLTGLIIIASIAGAAVSYVFAACYYGLSLQRRKALQLEEQAALVVRRGAETFSRKEVEELVHEIGDLPYDVVEHSALLRDVWQRREHLTSQAEGGRLRRRGAQIVASPADVVAEFAKFQGKTTIYGSKASEDAEVFRNAYSRRQLEPSYYVIARVGTTEWGVFKRKVAAHRLVPREKARAGVWYDLAQV